MKDNYSWLDDCLLHLETRTALHGADMAKDGMLEAFAEAKQTIISQIEIEKLRASKELLEELFSNKLVKYQDEWGYKKVLLDDINEDFFRPVQAKVAQLQDKFEIQFMSFKKQRKLL